MTRYLETGRGVFFIQSPLEPKSSSKIDEWWKIFTIEKVANLCLNSLPQFFRKAYAIGFIQLRRLFDDFLGEEPIGNFLQSLRVRLTGEAA